ncbi:predicted protein [Uncinocarpus reesii 1704]|uniref:Uncharacterized protein n=1 Tax=Uncinocarpus reesii (strain UAMH 1704) TaxID=336963 RepID=C4JMZ2_UNCRE|nr:uncharacterized protein UREG_04200 [Uncinocarpus reesii 1704]EEP79354.1 predicted protein [Uncinocarpus reesii 1704]
MSSRSSKTSSFKHFTTADSSLLSCRHKSDHKHENGADTEMVDVNLTAEIHIMNDNISDNNGLSDAEPEPMLQLSIFIEKFIIIAEKLLKKSIISVKKSIMSSVIQIKKSTVLSADIKKSVVNSVI